MIPSTAKYKYIRMEHLQAREVAGRVVKQVEQRPALERLGLEARSFRGESLRLCLQRIRLLRVCTSARAQVDTDHSRHTEFSRRYAYL